MKQGIWTFESQQWLRWEGKLPILNALDLELFAAETAKPVDEFILDMWQLCLDISQMFLLEFVLTQILENFIEASKDCI